MNPQQGGLSSGSNSAKTGHGGMVGISPLYAAMTEAEIEEVETYVLRY